MFDPLRFGDHDTDGDAAGSRPSMGAAAAPREVAARHDESIRQAAAADRARAARLAARGADAARPEVSAGSADLLDRARELLAAAASAELELLGVLGEIDALGVSDQVEGLATAQWVSRFGRCSIPTARRRIRVARTLRDKLPDEAVQLVADGVVGPDHVGVIERLSNGRIAHEWYEMTPELFESAIDTTFDAWTADVEAEARRIDADGGYDPAADVLANRLKVSTTDEFTLLSGQLVGEYAELVRQSIDAEAQVLYRSFWADHLNLGVEMPGWPTLRSLRWCSIHSAALST